MLGDTAAVAAIKCLETPGNAGSQSHFPDRVTQSVAEVNGTAPSASPGNILETQTLLP
jgi:hypothetical protein